MTTVRVRLALIAVLAGNAGCTLVSGWSDLQGGALATADGGTDAGADASDTPIVTDAEPPSDSAPEDSASADVPGVACGATRCAQGQGCCATLLGQGGTCQASAASCGPANMFETCSDSSQCTAALGHAAQCCSSTAGVPSVSCRTTCAAGDALVCDPTLVSPTCPAGKTCQPSVDGFGSNTCQ